MIDYPTDPVDPFDEDCPDCAPLCAEALEELCEWLTESTRQKSTPWNRIATLLVITNRLTVPEAAEQFQVSKRRIYQNMEDLSSKFGLEYRHGKLL